MLATTPASSDVVESAKGDIFSFLLNIQTLKQCCFDLSSGKINGPIYFLFPWLTSVECTDKNFMVSKLIEMNSLKI